MEGIPGSLWECGGNARNIVGMWKECQEHCGNVERMPGTSWECGGNARNIVGMWREYQEHCGNVEGMPGTLIICITSDSSTTLKTK